MSGADIIARGLAAQANGILRAASDYPAALSLIERLNREGDPISSSGILAYTSFPTPTGAGTGTPFGMPAVSVGRALFVQQATYWSTTPVAMRCQIGQSQWTTGIGTSPFLDIGFMCGPGVQASLSINAFMRSADKASGGAGVTRWLDPAVSGTQYIGAGATGFQLADAINFDAKKVILFLGDSLWNGTGPSSVLTCVPWLINKFYRDSGIDCRYILKAYSGSTSGGHETFRQGGKYEFERVDAIFYNLGVNDGVQGLTTAQSIANLQALMAWKQARYPHAKLVVFGPTPLQTNAYETAMVALRAAQSAAITALGDPNILFCDLGNSFDRTVNGNYASSETAGAGIHPGDTGLTQEWNGGYNGNAGLRAWLAANLPAI